MARWDNTEIVSLDQAKTHAKRSLTQTDEDDDFTLKLRQAHGLVLDYVASSKDDDYVEAMLLWDEDSAPAAVQAAIMVQFKDLDRFRGDDDQPSENDVDGFFLSPRVRRLLTHYRDPTIA